MRHAELGASSSHRWMACPGSIRMQQGIPDEVTPYAIEGTVAHRVGEMALQKKLPADTWLDIEIDGITVTEEMCEAVQVFVDTVHEYMALDPKAILFIETEFDLAALNPPGPMFGTSDACVLLPTLRRLIVIDFKYGKGIAVEAIGNPQLRYYGLGALLQVEKTDQRAKGRIREIELVIVQPRAHHTAGIVRKQTLLYYDLVEFAGELLAAARATLPEDAPLFAGDHCRFCRAKAVCPAVYEKALAVAQVEFDGEIQPVSAPPPPEKLPPEMLSEILQDAHIVEDWLSSVRAHVIKLLKEDPASVPGYKLVPKRAMRKWTSEDATIAWLEEQGFGKDDTHKHSLKSVAQIEKLLKTNHIKLAEGLFEKKSSGVNLAPDADVRPAVIEAEVEFPALPSGETK